MVKGCVAKMSLHSCLCLRFLSQLPLLSTDVYVWSVECVRAFLSSVANLIHFFLYCYLLVVSP